MRWTVKENSLLERDGQGLVVEGRRNVALCFAQRDAALISSAPEMFVALNNAKTYLSVAYEWAVNWDLDSEEGLKELNDAIEQCCAALAKAEGRAER